MPNPSQNPTPPRNREVERRRRAIEQKSAANARQYEAQRAERERTRERLASQMGSKDPEKFIFDPRDV